MATHLLGAQNPSCFSSSFLFDFVGLLKRPEGDVVEGLCVARGFQLRPARKKNKRAFARTVRATVCSNAKEGTEIDKIDGQNANR